MKLSNSSHSAGDNRANPTRLPGTSGVARLGATFLGATILLATPASACAKDSAAPVSLSSNGTAEASQELPAHMAATMRRMAILGEIDMDPSLMEHRPWMDAQDASMDEDLAIGYIVSGRTERFTNQQLQDGIGTLFTRDNGVEGDEVSAFGENEERMGASVSFYIAGAEFGPLGINDGIAQVPRMAQMFIEHRDVVNSRATSSAFLSLDSSLR